MLKGCGCQERKEIMFTEGNLGWPEYAFLGLFLAALLLAWRLK